MPFVILPVNNDDFQKLTDKTFLKFLACFGVNLKGQANPRVDSSVQKENFESQVKLSYATMYKLFGHDENGNMADEINIDAIRNYSFV